MLKLVEIQIVVTTLTNYFLFFSLQFTVHPIYCDICFILPSASDILRYILYCRTIAIYDLPINLRYIYKRVSPLITSQSANDWYMTQPFFWFFLLSGKYMIIFINCTENKIIFLLAYFHHELREIFYECTD